MPTVVVDGLARHVEAFPTKGLFFTNDAGDMIRRSNFGTMWLQVTKTVGLDGLRFHDLRDAPPQVSGYVVDESVGTPGSIWALS